MLPSLRASADLLQRGDPPLASETANLAACQRPAVAAVFVDPVVRHLFVQLFGSQVRAPVAVVSALAGALQLIAHR